jgi:type IV secretion system protein VirB9
MKHLPLTALAATLCLAAWPAAAMVECKPSKADQRVCFVEYDPNNVLHVNAALHGLTMFEFSPDELNPQLAAVDTNILTAVSVGNSMVLKPQPSPTHAWDTQTLVLYTTRPDGSKRTYVIQFDVRQNGAITEGSGVTFKIVFTYPGDVKAKQIAAWRAQQAQAAAEEAKRRLTVTGPGPGSGYPGYVCDYVSQNDPKHDPTFMPTRVCDDNQATFFTFPGNMEVPTLTVDGPDGKAMVPMQNFDRTGSYIAVHGVYKHYYLRIGDALICVWKTGHIDQVGYNPGTGTARSDVERVLKPLPPEEPK